MRSGTIMELKGSTAVVITDDCDFVKIQRTENMELGQKVAICQEIRKPRQHIFNNKVIGALLAACLIFGFTGAYVLSAPSVEEPYAYVTLDINPSIELGINREYKIVSFRNFNADGKIVLDQLSLKGETLDKALKSIIDEARNMGYFKNDITGAVLITAIPNSKYSDFKNYENRIIEDLSDLVDKEEALLEKAEENGINITVEIVKPAIREAAKKKNISAGRQYLINNAKKSGATDITVAEIKKANITELLIKHGDKLLGEKALKDYKKHNRKNRDKNVTKQENLVNQVTPVTSLTPVISVIPVTSVTPVISATPVTSVTPAISVIPAISVTPVISAKQEKREKQKRNKEEREKLRSTREELIKQAALIKQAKQQSIKDKIIKKNYESILRIKDDTRDEEAIEDNIKGIKDKMDRWSKWGRWDKVKQSK